MSTPPVSARDSMLDMLGWAHAIHTGDTARGYDPGVLDGHGTLDPAAMARLLLASAALAHLLVDSLAASTGMPYDRAVQCIAAHLIGAPASTQPPT